MRKRDWFLKAYCYGSGALVALASVGIVGYYAGQLIAVKDAEAAMAVIDAAGLGKMTTTINELGKQVNLLEENTKQNRQFLDAIGEAGKVAVPFVNGQKVLKRLNRSWGCLVLGADDLKRAMPGLDFSEIDLGSICGARDFYKKGLFIDPEQFKNLSPYQREKLILLFKKRRENVASESVLRALGTATTALEANKEYNASIEDLKSAVDGTNTQNERLAVIASGQVLIAQGIAQTNQLLSQLLKLQASMDANQVGIANGTLSDKVNDPNKTTTGGGS